MNGLVEISRQVMLDFLAPSGPTVAQLSRMLDLVLIDEKDKVMNKAQFIKIIRLVSIGCAAIEKGGGYLGGTYEMTNRNYKDSIEGRLKYPPATDYTRYRLPGGKYIDKHWDDSGIIAQKTEEGHRVKKKEQEAEKRRLNDAALKDDSGKPIVSIVYRMPNYPNTYVPSMEESQDKPNFPPDFFPLPKDLRAPVPAGHPPKSLTVSPEYHQMLIDTHTDVSAERVERMKNLYHEESSR